MGILLAIHDFVMINVVSCYHGTAGEADVLESLTNGRCAFSLLIFMRLLFFFLGVFFVRLCAHVVLCTDDKFIFDMF